MLNVFENYSVRFRNHHISSIFLVKKNQFQRQNSIKINSCDHLGWTALHQACKANNLEIYKLLISSDAQSVKTLDNQTPLMIAAQNASDNIVCCIKICVFLFKAN